MTLMSNEPLFVFECFQAHCNQVFEAAGEDNLVEIVTAHMSDAHDTFELEDVIMANAVLRKRD